MENQMDSPVQAAEKKPPAPGALDMSKSQGADEKEIAGREVNQAEPGALPETLVESEIPVAQWSSQQKKTEANKRPANDFQTAKVLTENESVQRAKFPQLREEKNEEPLGKIEYLKDVDLEASVELGNTVLTIEKIIGLNMGSIVELNQSIGDQIRLLINGNPYAFGEVVVIGDKFGVRITKIINE